MPPQNNAICPSQQFRSLSVILDSTLSFESHVNNNSLHNFKSRLKTYLFTQALLRLALINCYYYCSYKPLLYLWCIYPVVLLNFVTCLFIVTVFTSLLAVGWPWVFRKAPLNKNELLLLLLLLLISHYDFFMYARSTPHSDVVFFCIIF